MSELRTNASSIVGPLNFSQLPSLTPKIEFTEIDCLLCSKKFNFPTERDIYLAHLFLKHKLVISEEKQIAFIEEYLIFWHEKFQNDEITNALDEYCTTMLLNHLPDGTPAIDEKYYLLSDVLPQDHEIRKKLHMKRLEQVLAQHQIERTDRTYKRECLHCRDVITPTRAAFVEHLFQKHFLLLGKAENLVFVDELIDDVQDKLDRLICLFCSKVFKDRPTLKEHMRKKGHKRINPSNKSYDKYFLINYKNEMENQHTAKQSVQAMFNRTNASSGLFQSDSDSDWSDWEGEKLNLTCLFCSATDTDLKDIKKHMTISHDVNLDDALAGLTFYEKVKVINYLRRQMHSLKCVTCDEKFETSKLLQDHLVSLKHYGIGQQSNWDHPEFFFPTYEDDTILCHLDDSNDDSSVSDDVVVISEDTNLSINPDAEQLSKENLLIF